MEFRTSKVDLPQPEVRGDLLPPLRGERNGRLILRAEFRCHAHARILPESRESGNGQGFRKSFEAMFYHPFERHDGGHHPIQSKKENHPVMLSVFVPCTNSLSYALVRMAPFTFANSAPPRKSVLAHYAIRNAAEARVPRPFERIMSSGQTYLTPLSVRLVVAWSL
jgi:hypothetical protein